MARLKTKVQTQALIQELVANKPELIDDIEYFAERVAPPVVVDSSPNSKPQRQITIDANRIRSQVRYIPTCAIKWEVE